MMVARTSQRVFVGFSALLFAASAALTIVGCAAMSAMHDMPMPGGWTMSMMWMRMPGQSWPGTALPFLGMWTVMMMAMMLPSLLPMLWRYRAGVGIDHLHVSRLTAIVAVGYFAVWTLLGALAFCVGISIATLEMRLPELARMVPMASGVIVLCGGALQFSAWKQHHLACCRSAPGRCQALSATARAAWRHGVRLGVHCVDCCAGFTAILLVIGVMDLRAMALVTAAISVERLAPAGARTARVVGVIVVAVGLHLIARAALLG